MFTPELRRRLSEIARDQAREEGTGGNEHTERLSPAVPGTWPPAPGPLRVPSFRQVRNDFGVFAVTRWKLSELASEVAPWLGWAATLRSPVVGGVSDPDRSAWSGSETPPTTKRHPATRLLFLDIETCGLGGVPVFLVGTMQMSGTDLVVRQMFARDYSEERSLLADAGRVLSRSRGLVTFNGKSFDVPYLSDRMAYHGLEFTRPGVHYDVLHDARRRFRGVLPDCRLVTLERFVCRRARADDVDGCEIPGLYHEFVRTGNLDLLLPVFRHNVMDLLTMAELFGMGNER